MEKCALLIVHDSAVLLACMILYMHTHSPCRFHYLLCSYDTGLKKPNRRIDTLNSILEDRQFLVGDSFTVADVAISSYLLYVVQFFPDVDLSRWPHLVKYMEICLSRPAYLKAFGEGTREFLADALANMGKKKGMFGGMF